MQDESVVILEFTANIKGTIFNDVPNILCNIWCLVVNLISTLMWKNFEMFIHITKTK